MSVYDSGDGLERQNVANLERINSKFNLICQTVKLVRHICVDQNEICYS